ncbi:hypothetical protein HanPSC8_Chr07g0300281 [Helianthus annuus]|nr:hypothetical protein HanIR_Chr07g0335011 [Helianthus annuus]KAJ0905981.1 hypothetical protein HanPSC8_Chr07g0300281 [Helianthus annuus]
MAGGTEFVLHSVKLPSPTQSPSLAAPRMSSRKLKLSINTRTWIESAVTSTFRLRIQRNAKTRNDTGNYSGNQSKAQSTL